MIKALVIDDEKYAREELIDLLEENGTIEVIGECSNAIEALKKINALKPDVIFLDIQMPQITGIEMLSMLDPDTMPKVVFVTAYDEYALKAFEDNAFDYLLKPVETCRLTKTIKRLERECQPADYSPIVSDMLELIPCSGHNRILLLRPDEIETAYSDLTGVHIVGRDTEATTQLTLKTLEEKTPLIRCHRQYLIHPTAIREIKLLENGLAEITTLGNHHVPVSRRYLKELKDRFGLC
ncbi:two-component system response regulator BtsR [Photobacterium sp. DA100]|uniref:two-component system response regulator BtsR n=1 Tax=Photobacterium sp. DA100 TaxID=3027472 RepID=UPI00247845C8|nr:two-component system response regulator BtsR [Photobacterium sp. DA100]WEM42793.1 two-component system response regulator BtsR [Photobacterium sp. DA100]